jgi:hypothetical protein
LESDPEFLETHSFGRTFQLGSLAGGTPVGSSDVSGLKIVVADTQQGIATHRAASGRRVALQLSGQRRGVVRRDGKGHDWQRPARFVYGSLAANRGIIHQERLSGELAVQAGGPTFRGIVDDRGIATQGNLPAHRRADSLLTVSFATARSRRDAVDSHPPRPALASRPVGSTIF